MAKVGGEVFGAKARSEVRRGSGQWGSSGDQGRLCRESVFVFVFVFGWRPRAWARTRRTLAVFEVVVVGLARVIHAGCGRISRGDLMVRGAVVAALLFGLSACD